MYTKTDLDTISKDSTAGSSVYVTDIASRHSQHASRPRRANTSARRTPQALRPNESIRRPRQKSVNRDTDSTMGYIEELGDSTSTRPGTTFHECNPPTEDASHSQYETCIQERSAKPNRHVIIHGAEGLRASSFHEPTLIPGNVAVIQSGRVGQDFAIPTPSATSNHCAQVWNLEDGTGLLVQASASTRDLDSKLTPAERTRMSWNSRFQS